MNKTKRKNGFTLIELLVVIAIIGILATMVLVALGGARAKARDAARESDIRQIALAMVMKYDEAEGYPTYDTTGTFKDIAGTQLGLTDYLPESPDDPLGDRHYVWIKNGTGTSQKYCVFAKLEAKKDEKFQYFSTTHKGTFVLEEPGTGADGAPTDIPECLP